MTTNPCFSCNGVVVETQSVCKPGDCICFCDIYISPKADEAVICSQTGTINLFDYPNDTTVCDADLQKYQLMIFDEDFYTSASISENGVLTWVPAPNSTTKTGVLVFKILCGDLAKLVTVTIGRKSNCTGVICPSGEYCNDCSGECAPQTNTNFDLKVNVQ
jgi:hypothetical protein